MSKRNVSISSLLGSNSDEASAEVSKQGDSSVPNLLSKYRASIDVSPTPATNPSESGEKVIVVKENDEAKSKQSNRKPVAIRPSPLPTLIPKPNSSTTPAPTETSPQPLQIPSVIKKFQTSFQLGGASNVSSSKTSINSIINIDDEPEVINVEATPTPAPSATPATSTKATTAPKKKRAPAKKKNPDDPPAKKRKTQTQDDNDKKQAKAGEKSEPKTSNKGKKKTPEVVTVPDPEKPPIHPGSTTDKAATKSTPNLPAPTVIDLLNPMKEDEPKKKERDEKKDEKKDEKFEPPIIALEIPLIDPKDPKPGQSEVVINVLRLSEEKYGWSAIHPKAKSAIDIMDDIIDDDDDAMDEDEEEEPVEEEEKPVLKKKKDDELTEEQLVRQHEVKMNRKVGKYDYEDPFIDDEELQMEEEITSTKEGFFVYWGPLVDDRNLTAGAPKKGSSKAKK